MHGVEQTPGAGLDTEQAWTQSRLGHGAGLGSAFRYGLISGVIRGKPAARRRVS